MAASTLILPPHLRRGELIGVVSPARWLEDARLEAAVKTLEDAGFRVRVDEQNRLRDGPFAGSDSERRKALECVFADAEVKAILCARGGYGALRIADALDYDIIRTNPKIFIGYSDITGLLLAIHRHAGLATLHGPMLVDLADRADGDSLAHLVATLTGGAVSAIAGRVVRTAKALRAGSGEGRIIGGNLTILANVIGTGSDFDTRGAVLFIEDVDEYLYNIDRMLVHLKRAGKFDRLEALMLGSFARLKDNEIPFARTVEEMVLEHCAGTAFPIVSGFPVGHDGPNMTVPIGVRARVDASEDGPVSFRLHGGQTGQSIR